MNRQSAVVGIAESADNSMENAMESRLWRPRWKPLYGQYTVDMHTNEPGCNQNSLDSVNISSIGIAYKTAW